MGILELYYLLIPPAAAFLFFGSVWLLWGRGPTGGKDTVAVQFTPPEGLGVLECGVLYDDIVNTQDIALELLDLAFKGILEIKDNKSFTLVKGQSTPEYLALTEGQQILLQILFEDNPERIIDASGSAEAFAESIKWYQIRSSVAQRYFYKSYLLKLSRRIDELKLAIYESLTNRGYFPVSPHNQRLPYFSLAGLLFAVPILFNLYALFETIDSRLVLVGEKTIFIPWTLVIGLALAAIIISFIGSFMARKTIKGKESKACILGLKEYIQTAEIDRIKFILENDITAYRQLLPFAGLFNSLEKWLSPVKNIEQSLISADLAKVLQGVSALDVEASFSERKRWPQALLSLFMFGLKLIPKRKRRNIWDDGGFSI